MLDSRRSLTAAAFGALLLTPLAASVGAQETNTVGPPVLKDFRLPGQRTTPPLAEPQPTPPPPDQATPSTTETPAPRDRTTAPATSTPARETPRPAPRATGQVPASTSPPPAATPSAPASASELPPQAQPLPPPAQLPADELPEAPAGRSWLYFAVPGTLVLLAFLAIARRGRRALGPEEAPEYAAPAAEAEAEETVTAPAAPAPAPRPAPPAPAVAGPRPWLEIDITPERAVATDKEAVVHYELILRNTGQTPARNIRIDTKLFNASQEAEMNAFFSGSIHEQSGSPQIVIEPGSGLFLVGQVALPKEEVQEVRVQGRSLFIPLVAMNVAYDWDEAGTGRTSKSWLVGREPETPSAKMGAFRLDLGPRVYRSVAGREARLVKV